MTTMRSRKKSLGFTLVEVMIAGVISLAVGGFLVYLLFTTARSAKAFQSQSFRQVAASAAMEVIVKELRNANSVDTISTPTTNLTFVSFDGDNIEFEWDKDKKELNYIVDGTKEKTWKYLSDVLFSNPDSRLYEIKISYLYRKDKGRANTEDGELKGELLTDVFIRN
ncbi:MAG: prepilin-type N-terminal cleavage/methylation domain-containing protein [bacterium]